MSSQSRDAETDKLLDPTCVLGYSGSHQLNLRNMCLKSYLVSAPVYQWIFLCYISRNKHPLKLLDMRVTQGTFSWFSAHPFSIAEMKAGAQNAETGISKGRGYVTMSSLNESKAAITALDGSVNFRCRCILYIA